jgi:lipopolysaccharide export system protein LptA
MPKFAILLFLPFFTIGILSTNAQIASSSNTSGDNDTSSFVQIIKADIFRRIKQDSTAELNLLIGNVLMKQNNTLFYCDSAIQNQTDNQFEAFGNIHINDSDSVHTYSQYLKYIGDTKIAELKKKVRLTDGKGVLTTEALSYNVNTRVGTYLNGGKVVNGESVLTSKEGIYEAITRDVYFKTNVKLVDPEYRMTTDTLLYNVNTEVATFLAPTIITDDHSRIKTRAGFYDLKFGKAQFENRPIIEDSTQMVVSDMIDYNKATSQGKAVGNVVYTDSSQGLAIVSGLAIFNNQTKAVLAYEHPVMKIKQSSDTLFVAADTLYSEYDKRDSISELKKSDTTRLFRANYNVRMFSDSIQGKCDSLYYSGIDSVFRFFYAPVIWSQENQLSGDTIFLFTKYKKPDRVTIQENSFSINRTAEGMFNQLKGNSMNGFFVGGEIDYLKTKGNSESFYYLQDKDSAYIGVSYAMADVIAMKFQKKELKRVTWINSVTGTLYPYNQIPEDKKELRNFKWLDALRPKKKEDLIQHSTLP